MYVYMYNIDWIRGWKIRISFFLFKRCEIVNQLGNWRRGTPPYLVHITVCAWIVAVKLNRCDVSHKANRRLCNAERGAGSARYGSNRHCMGRGEPFRVALVG